MNCFYPILCCLLFSAFTIDVQAQLLLTLKYAPESETWEVYAKPHDTLYPSMVTITGSGQVTLVVPTGFEYTDLKNSGGTWLVDAIVNNPPENPGFDYISFGLINDYPQIVYENGKETLLFSFKKVGSCPDTLHLIDQNDPFNINGNSGNSTPDNDFSVVDFGLAPTKFYHYTANYDLSAWNCGKPTNGPGNGKNVTATDGSFHHEFDPNMNLEGLPADPVGQSEAGHFLNGKNKLVENAPKHFTLTPNPAKDWFLIHFTGAISQQGDVIYLSDFSGMIWKKRSPGAGQSDFSIDIADLPAGSYLLSLQREGKLVQQERLVKF